MSVTRAAGGGRKKASGSTALVAPGKEALNRIDPPDALRDDHAVQMWETQAAVLCQRGSLTLADAPQLLIYCNSFSLYLEAEAALLDEGMTVFTAQGGAKKNPLVNVRQDAISAMTRSGALLGLDPLSRTRLIGGGESSGKAANEFADF